MTGDNSKVGKCNVESLQVPATEKSLNARQPSSMPASDTSGQGGATTQDEVPANMLPSVSAAMAKPEAFGAAFEVAFALPLTWEQAPKLLHSLALLKWLLAQEPAAQQGNLPSQQ